MMKIREFFPEKLAERDVILLNCPKGKFSNFINKVLKIIFAKVCNKTMKGCIFFYKTPT